MKPVVRLLLAIGVVTAAVFAIDRIRDNPDATALAQIERGFRAYTALCAACHESDRADGRLLDSTVLAAYANAQALFDSVTTTVSHRSVANPADETAWDIVAYLLDSRGLLERRQPVNAGTAARIVPRRDPVER